MNNDEKARAFRVGNSSVVHTVWNVQRTTLNYYTGFWIMPYETVVVNFRITSNYSYVLQTMDYRTVCGDSAKMTSVDYSGSNVSGIVQDLDDIAVLSCGVMYPPQLINTPPKVIYMRSMFPILDGYIKILGYEGGTLPSALPTFQTTLGSSTPSSPLRYPSSSTGGRRWRTSPPTTP